MGLFPRGVIMTNANKIRKDLRQLKVNVHAVNALEKAYNTHIKRIKMLEGLEQNDYTVRLINRERDKLNSLDFKGQIEELTSLEIKYKDLIFSLPSLEKTIMVDCFFNGKSYWQIGALLGFSEEGIRKKVGLIINKLAKNLSDTQKNALN